MTGTARGPFAQPLAQDYQVIFHNRDADTRQDGGALTRLPDGRLLATVNKDRGYGNGSCDVPFSLQVARGSADARQWEELPSADIFDGQPFVHEGELYLLGHRLGRHDIVISRSDDLGRSWSDPVTVAGGLFWNAPTGVVVHQGRLYRPFTGPPPEATGFRHRQLSVLVGDLSGDLMDPSSWRLSNRLGYPGTPEQLKPGRHPDFVDHWLEPNLLNVRGRLRVLLRTRIDRYATCGIVAVCDLDDRDGEAKLRFTQFHPMPGAQQKFHVVYDEVSDLFWTAVNLVTDPQDTLGRAQHLEQSGLCGTPGNERRILALMYSVDALNWLPAGIVAMWRRPSRSFHYASLLTDGDDLLLLVRTSKDAPNQHDSELTTLHRVERFRDLALDVSMAWR